MNTKIVYTIIFFVCYIINFIITIKSVLHAKKTEQYLDEMVKARMLEVQSKFTLIDENIKLRKELEDLKGGKE